MSNCVDQLFALYTSRYTSPLWKGYAADYTHRGPFRGFQGVIQQLLSEGNTLSAGPYCIVRLDRSVDTNNEPELAWVGTVHDDMTVTEGLRMNSNQRVTHWPPKTGVTGT